MYAFATFNPDTKSAVHLLNLLINQIYNKNSGLLNGAGSIASSEMVENAVQWAIDIANDNSHGYDQGSRLGPDYDCSSLVCSAFAQAGFNINPAGTTYTMQNAFTSIGFTWIPWSQIGDTSKLLRGDILLATGHTEIYIGNNQNVGAHCNEFGGITGGKSGDQTGQEISINGYWYGNWNGVLRYENKNETNTITIPSQYGGGIKSYEYYEINWAAGTNQRALYNKWVNAGKQYNNSIAVYDNRYIVACTPKFGSVGDKVNWTLDNGEIIKTIIGDIKNTSDAGANEWGHSNGAVVLEFCVASGYTSVTGSVTSTMPQWNSRVAKAELLGESVL